MHSPLAAAEHRTLLPSWPASLQLLLGEPAGELWSSVLASADGRLRGLRATSVTLQPDGAATVRYAADAEWPGGRTTREALVAITGRRIPEGATVLEAADGTRPVRVGLWRWPRDPALPGLSWATSAAATADRLTELGLGGGPLRLRLRAYRPGRRAVVEAIGPGGDRRFLKVVRPAATDALVHRHELLAGAVPAPPVLAATADGVVVLPALAGTPMRGLLAGTEGGPGDLPTPAALDAVLDALPSALVEAPARSRRAAGDALGRAADHAAVLGTVAPALRGRLDDLTARLRAADPGEHPEVPVHGDFYEAQLLVDGGAVVGLLDVDTAGRGHRIDDWANLLGHLVVLEQVLPDPAITARYRTELVAAALRRWPAAQLRLRVAAVLLGLATGPFRVQQPDWPARTDARLELAEHWADPAHGPLRDVGG